MGNGHANLVPYQAFRVADGEMIVAVGNDAQFERLCAILGPGGAGQGCALPDQSGPGGQPRRS